jgi:hypothetical protein
MRACFEESMIPKSGYRFSEKIMLNKAVERDDDSKKNHPALETKTPASGAPGVRRRWNFCLVRIFCFVLGYANSERAQQNGADKRKHGTDRQHIEPQSKVHVTCSVLVAPTQNSSKSSRDGEATNILRCATHAESIVPSLREPTQRFDSSS